MKFFSIRKDIYQHNFLLQNQKSKSFIGIKKPYTLIKSIYYVETASLFLYATHKIIKSPNLITLIYILFGLVGSFFIALNYSNTLFYVGLFMVFTKGTFDWADGPLARRLNKTSFLGHALDIYGASIGDAAFRIAFVFYALSNYLDYMFLFPLFSFILLLPKFNTFADFLYLKNIENEQLCLKKKR